MDGPRVYYVRGAGGVVLPTRRVLAVVLALIAAALTVVTLAVLIVDLQHTEHRRALARNGIRVDVTITGCVANASGTGITESGFTCRGRYEVGGKVYDQVMHGSSEQLPVGIETLAVTSSVRPTELYSLGSIRGDLSYRSALIVPMILAGLLLLTLGCEFATLRTAPNRRRFSVGKSHVDTTQNSASLRRNIAERPSWMQELQPREGPWTTPASGSAHSVPSGSPTGRNSTGI
jgi:hypothetical protein